MRDHLSLSLEMDDYYRLSINTNALFLFFRCNISLSNSCHQIWEQNINYLNKPMGDWKIEAKREKRILQGLLRLDSGKRTIFWSLQSIHTQYTFHSPLPIKWLPKETQHYLSHILRFGAHVFFQHKKLIPYPATFNPLEMGLSPRQVDNIFFWLCG